MEIGAIQPGEPMSAPDAALAMLRLQNQIDSWAADRLTLSIQSETSITWPSSTSTQTIGLAGANITAPRPVWIAGMTYVIPGSSPAVEVQLAELDNDQYRQITIKALTSALPTQFFYQTDITTLLGTIYLWPQPLQQITLKLYAPVAVGVPATLDSILLGPPGYQEAFMYQLALRLCTPFARDVPKLLPKLAQDALATMKRPNVDPGLLGTDAALVGSGGGYNVYSDNSSAPGAR